MNCKSNDNPLEKVWLVDSENLPDPQSYTYWLSVTGTAVNPDTGKKLPRLAERLETAYEDSRQQWWQLGKAMAMEKTAETCHAPTGGVYGSDFGLMLAWSKLVGDLKNSRETVLVVCDDPWMFRHLSAFDHVKSGKPPGLFLKTIKMVCRGFMARFMVMGRILLAQQTFKKQRRIFPKQAPVMLVYGHPESDETGKDAYFGNLLDQAPDLQRLVHVDCLKNRALELCRHDRTFSLHAWGSVMDAIRVVFEYWRPGKKLTHGDFGWIIKRAARYENSGGGPAMVRWQILCQRRFLKQANPRVIFWPWENFAWERDLCRAGKKSGIRTAGYQHTAIGRHQINYAVYGNPDPEQSLPDVIIANGPAYQAELINWGHDESRVKIGGSWRITEHPPCPYDKNGPIFVPLSGQLSIARQQLKCAEMLAEQDIPVLVKEHPMYPLDFKSQGLLRRTTQGLYQQPALRAMLFTTGTSGLEATLSGIPAYRLQLDDRFSINIYPDSVSVPSAGINDIGKIIKTSSQPDLIRWNDLFSKPDLSFWLNL